MVAASQIKNKEKSALDLARTLAGAKAARGSRKSTARSAAARSATGGREEKKSAPTISRRTA